MTVIDGSADTIFHNAVVRTLDQQSSVASAIAVKGDRIVGVGTLEDFDSIRAQRTRVVDVGGRVIMPSFTDGHTHFQKGALNRHLFLNFDRGASASVSTVLGAVRDRALQTPPGEWIRGEGINESFVEEKRLPTRYELDEMAPDNPTILITFGNHSIAANSAALHHAGITRDTPDPSGGRIERDEAGEPTGILRETGKLRLDNNHPDNVIPHYTVSQRVDALKKTVAEVHQWGITGIHDMMVDPYEIASWIHLRRENELKLRVQMLIRGIETRTPMEYILGLGLQHGLGDAWLRFGGVKFSIDGICAFRMAAIYGSYPGEPDNHGLMRIPEDELTEAIVACHRAGVRVSVHAVGPRATDAALNAFTKASDGKPMPEMRHRLEHIHLPPPPGQIERIAELGLVGSIQPAFIWLIGDAWTDIWGLDGLKNVMPLRSMLNSGIRLMGGTDYGGHEINPFLVMRSAMARLTRNGEVLDISHALTVDEAIRLETIDAAWGGFEENLKGTLEAGKLADLLVLSEDPYHVAPADLEDVRVDLTMVGGENVYVRDGANLAGLD